MWHTHQQRIKKRFTKHKNDNASANYEFFFVCLWDERKYIHSLFTENWEEHILSIERIEFQQMCALHFMMIWRENEIEICFGLSNSNWNTPFFAASCFQYHFGFDLKKHINISFFYYIVVHIFCCRFHHTIVRFSDKFLLLKTKTWRHVCSQFNIFWIKIDLKLKIWIFLHFFFKKYLN